MYISSTIKRHEISENGTNDIIEKGRSVSRPDSAVTETKASRLLIVDKVHEINPQLFSHYSLVTLLFILSFIPFTSEAIDNQYILPPCIKRFVKRKNSSEKKNTCSAHTLLPYHTLPMQRHSLVNTG